MTYKRLTARDENGVAFWVDKPKSFYVAEIYEEEKALERKRLDQIAEIEDKITHGELIFVPFAVFNIDIDDEKYKEMDLSERYDLLYSEYKLLLNNFRKASDIIVEKHRTIESLKIKLIDLGRAYENVRNDLNARKFDVLYKIASVITEFDEMGYAPTTLCPDVEAEIIKFKKKIEDIAW